ncbi:MAG: NADH-quinone oxidoreductase subunit N [Bacteroidetes bacterium]|nr:MAG: NADH-quinone oxidoreductase subunit N [Bacteroidota bacterium]
MKAILVLSGLGIIALLAELFRFRRVLFPLVLLGLLGAVAAALSYFWFDEGKEWNDTYVKGMLVFDTFSILSSSVIIITGLLWLMMSQSYFKEESSKTDHYALFLFSMAGAVTLTCYNNMTMLFLGIEMLSIPLYVMAGSKKDSLASNEAALKYFLLGAFSTGFLLFGITLIYGATKSFDLPTISTYVTDHAGEIPGLFHAGIVMLLVGLLFKISAAPFHFWAPDVYQGSPTSVTAFMSTVVKTAAVAGFARLFAYPGFMADAAFWGPILAVCVVLTIMVGNVFAAVQNNVKRLLAYSSISHAGFLLLAILSNAPGSVIYYTAAYSLASLAAFAVLGIIMQHSGDDAMERFNGLGKRSPLLAFTLTLALLSMAGIPPTAGFFGKYYVFMQAFASGHAWLVLAGIIGSLIGVYYYFRIIIAMYFKDVPAGAEGSPAANDLQQLVLFITSLGILVLGIMPDLLLNLFK